MVSSSHFLLLPTCLSVAAAALASCALLPVTSSAFQLPPSTSSASSIQRSVGRRAARKNIVDGLLEDSDDEDGHNQVVDMTAMMSRRSAIATTIVSSLVASSGTVASAEEGSSGSGGESMYAPKFVQTYEDFTSTSEGWSYKDVKIGKDIGGGDLKDGDRVVFDWSGYTIGYFGRPFEAKGGPQGGAFDKDINYFRTTLGSKTLIPGLECALRSMKPMGIRQVIIPYGPLSYPPEDKEHELVGPKPTTFSGMRALNFVLENPRLDRTLLFNVKLIRVDRGDGKGGYIRG